MSGPAVGVVAPQPDDLTTLASVRAWLAITSTAHDDLLQRLLSAASRFIAQWTNREFASRSYTELRDGTGGDTLVFADYPVTAVASVIVDGRPVAASSGFGQPGYAFDDISIWLTGYAFARGRRNVSLAYTAGYATVPREIEQACIELVAMRYREIDRIGMVSKSVGGETISYSQRDMPQDVQTTLGNWRKVVPL